MTMIGDNTTVTKVLALVLAVESVVEDTITMIALGLEQVLLPEVAIQAERAKPKVKLNGMSGTKMTAHGERERKEMIRVEKTKVEKITVGKARTKASTLTGTKTNGKTIMKMRKG